MKSYIKLSHVVFMINTYILVCWDADIIVLELLRTDISNSNTIHTAKYMALRVLYSNLSFKTKLGSICGYKTIKF